MNLGAPPARYVTEYEAARNRELETADLQNLKRQSDIEMGQKAKLVVRSPGGSRWQITVSDAGVVGATRLS